MQRNALSAQPVALRSVYRFSLLTISCLSPCYYLSCQLRRKSNVSKYCIRFDPAENRTGTAEVDIKRFSSLRFSVRCMFIRKEIIVIMVIVTIIIRNLPVFYFFDLQKRRDTLQISIVKLYIQSRIGQS